MWVRTLHAESNCRNYCGAQRCCYIRYELYYCCEVIRQESGHVSFRLSVRVPFIRTTRCSPGLFRSPRSHLRGVPCALLSSCALKDQRRPSTITIHEEKLQRCGAHHGSGTADGFNWRRMLIFIDRGVAHSGLGMNKSRLEFAPVAWVEVKETR